MTIRSTTAAAAAASAEEAAGFARTLARTPGSGLQVERRHPGERDLVVEFSMCRAHGRSLVGAAPAELIGEVPGRWVVAVGDAQLSGRPRRTPAANNSPAHDCGGQVDDLRIALLSGRVRSVACSGRSTRAGGPR